MGKKTKKADGKKPIETVAPWKSRIVGHGDIDPRALEENPKNFRVHGELQRATFRAGIQKIGFINSVIVNKRTGRIINGHMRVSEAIQAGEPTIPVEWVDLTDSEEDAAIAVFDSISELAIVDNKILSDLLQDIANGGIDFSDAAETLAENQGVLEAVLASQIGVKSEGSVRPGDVSEKFMVVFPCETQESAEALQLQIERMGFSCQVKAL